MHTFLYVYYAAATTLPDKHYTPMPNHNTVSVLAGADYTATTAILTFESGATDGSTRTANVPIIDDGVVEGNETLNIRIFELSVTTDNVIISATAGNGIITIINDDGKFDECANIHKISCQNCIRFMTVKHALDSNL